MSARSSLLVCLLFASVAHARPPDHLQQRRAVEYKKRLNLARHQMRQYITTENPKLWVSGRRNRALAGRIRVKKWRAEAGRARARGDLRRAQRLEYRANRLGRAVGRFSAHTEQFVGQNKSYQHHEAQQRSRAVGSPIRRLWGERSTLAEHQKAQRSSVAGRIGARRLTLESLTGAKPMQPHEVQRWLAKLPGTGRKSISFSEQVGDLVYHWKLTRTGSKNARPEGHLWSRVEDPKTGEVITQYHGTRVSWARRDHGPSRSTVVLHHRTKFQKDGSVTIPAGTMTTVSRELNADGYRNTTFTETLAGARRQRTNTERRDGAAERYTLNRDAEGRMEELHSRLTPSGQWKSQLKFYDPSHGLLVQKEDSRGNRSERWVSPATEQRLLRRLMGAARGRKERIRHYKDGKWSWSKVVHALGSLGTVSAHGRQGLLGRVESSYVSPLGTRYGSVYRDVRGQISRPEAGARPVKSRTYDQARLRSQPAAEAPPQKKNVTITAADRRRLEQSEALATRVRKRPIRVIRDDMAGEENAFAQPTNNTIYGRTRVIKNVDVANIGSKFAKGSKALQLGVIFHEGGHEYQELRFLDPRYATHGIQARNLSAINREVPATVAGLLAADENRTMERGADRAAGHGLAKARRLTGDRSLTPADYVRALGQMQKGQPFNRVWTPLRGYDSLRERSRTTWRAYGAGLRKYEKPAK